VETSACSASRVGQLWNDNASLHQAVAIDPFNITNLFFNYTLRGSSRLSQVESASGGQQPDDSHAITAVAPASVTSNAPAPATC